MQIIKLAWVGTRTQNAEPAVTFFREVLGLRLELDQPGFWSEVDDSGNAWVHFRAPDGNIYELTQDPGVLRPG